MHLRLIAYPNAGAALTRWLVPGESLKIGRAHDCGLMLDDPSVSRAHASVHWQEGAWQLRDLGSKNGSCLEGLPTREAVLPPSGWLRLGDVHVEVAQFEPAQAALMRERADSRRARSQVLTRQVAQETSLERLLEDVLEGMLDLADCARGYVMLFTPQGPRVRAALRADGEGAFAGFEGSQGALQRVVESGQPVVVNHIGTEPWLSGRQSVVQHGLSSLLCLPLRDGARVFGALYADRNRPGEPITQFDLELLSAFAETATLGLLAHDALGALQDAPRWGTLALPGGAGRP